MHFPDVKGDWSTYSWEWQSDSSCCRGRVLVFARPALMTRAIYALQAIPATTTTTCHMNPIQMVKTYLTMRD